MKQIMLGLLIKLLFASNTFAQTAYYSYSAYHYINKSKKRFVKPVNGYIFRRKYFKGVFIRPKYNTIYVRSVISGIVVFAGFLKYYGNVIIIKHKYDLNTIYARIKKSYVKVGQFVKKGQIIGKVYRNKAIYFEVRKNIKPINAYAFLK